MKDLIDREAIDRTVATFFGEFDNRIGRIPSLGSLQNLFVDGAVIIRDSGSGNSQKYSVLEFAEPRILLLTNGALLDFYEEETNSTTDIAGSVASRSSVYRKYGRLHSSPYSGFGRKFFHLARMSDGWRIASVAWSDGC